MANNRRVLKKAATITVGVFAVLTVLLGVLYGVSKLVSRDKLDYTKRDESIYYFSADYDADPLGDEVYVAKDREVFFTDSSGFGEYLTAADGETATVRGLFYNYFEALKSGDAEKHRALLSEGYKKSFTVQGRFTPQKVYDISVSFLSGDSGGGRYYDRYRVTYKIYKNDGTYRADVGSDIAKTMVFEIVYGDGSPLINAIVTNYS